MRIFYLNEIFPDIVSIQEAVQSLEKTMDEYKVLKIAHPNSIDGIVSSSYSGNIIISKGLTLLDCIQAIQNQSLRGYTYSQFIKYPIDDYSDIDAVLEDGVEFHFLLNQINKDALSIKAVSNHNGTLFSLNLHDDLAKDLLTIHSLGVPAFEISNLYGIEENTKRIKEIIIKDETAKLNNIEKLERILKDSKFSTKFKNEFNAVSKDIQDLIINGFNIIIENQNKNINTPETLLKDVTPNKEKKISIKELKLRDPIAKRIYFSKIEDKYYLASLEKKPLKDKLTTEQSLHIKNALSYVKQERMMK